MSVPLSIDPVALQAEHHATTTVAPDETDGMGIKAIRDPHNKRMELTTPAQAAKDANIKVKGVRGERGRLAFGLPRNPIRRLSRRNSGNSVVQTHAEGGSQERQPAAKTKRSLSQKIKGALHLGRKEPKV